MKLFAPNAAIPAPYDAGGKARNLITIADRVRVSDFLVCASHSGGDTALPATLARDVAAALDEGDGVAVRSSANLEGVAASQFSGLFRSHLAVREGALKEAARDVLLSLNHPAVIDYCRLRGVEHKALRMSVIFQRMVVADFSGVCVSRLGDESDDAYVELVAGLGSGLASGEKHPEKFTVSRTTEYGVRRCSRAQPATLDHQPVPASRDTSDPALPSGIPTGLLTALVDSVLIVEKALHSGPVEVEWACRDGEPFILQAGSFRL
ncbi:PEP/pyruvate-binding domain-containing protein [Actinomadura sp. GTD37]|uniref:PEP/pyruvate-binding domain-containing protein n=1 Tax=Actinomadura sp. GTD37 TaxID=1778030 RepID=UPI0035C0EC81